MKLPIVAYGDPLLRKTAREIDKDYPDLKKLIENMFETMDSADGVGLAAPQVGLSIRLIVVNGMPCVEGACNEKDAKVLRTLRRAFINIHIEEESGEEWDYNEGCLSLPGIHENVRRPGTIKVRYRDEDWVEHVETFEGVAARIIQHEHDHLEGKLFIDHLSPLKKRLIQGRLNNISKGNVPRDYPMKFPAQHKRR